MKYHKIRNVEKSVCTIEQNVAYQIAFRLRLRYDEKLQSILHSDAAEVAKSATIDEAVRLGMEQFFPLYGKHADIDATQSALRAGFRDYLATPSIRVFFDWDSLGKAFPAYYL